MPALPLFRPSAVLLVLAAAGLAEEVPPAVPAPVPTPASTPASTPAAAAVTAAKPAPVPPPPATVPTGMPFSLEQALAVAATQATGPAIAKARLDQVRALQTQAWALLLPNADLTGSYGSTWHSRRPYRGRSDETLAGELLLQTRVFDGTAFPALDQAKVQYASQERASRDIRRATAFGVASAYLTVLAAERQRSVADRRLVVANQLLDEAKARLKAGLAIASDVTRAEVEVADGQLAVTQAQRAIEIGRLSLREALGGEVDPGVLADPLITAPDDQDVKVLLTRAALQRDDLAASRLTLDANRYAIERIRRGAWPVVSANAGVSDQDDNAPRVAGVSQADPAWFVGLSASWSLYDGGLRDGQLEQQAAVGREEQANLRAAQLAAEREVRGALIEIHTSIIAVSQAEAKARSAAADAADALARYRAGTGTATDLANSQFTSASSQADLEQRRIDVLSFRLSLRQALGGWPLAETEPVPAAAKP